MRAASARQAEGRGTGSRRPARTVPGLGAYHRRHGHLWRVVGGDLSWPGLVGTGQQSQASAEDQTKLQITIFRPAIETCFLSSR